MYERRGKGLWDLFLFRDGGFFAQHPYIVAEISANHSGCLERAKTTILAAQTAI